jgi:hypothetical protein
MKKLVIIGLILSLASIFLFAGCKTREPVDGQYAALGQCLTEKGVKFYGTFWCKYCKTQKEIFGDDLRYVDYVECDERGENGDPEACLDAGVDSYPTWVFPGQDPIVGVQQPADLAKKANCEDALNVKPETVTENGE